MCIYLMHVVLIMPVGVSGNSVVSDVSCRSLHENAYLKELLESYILYFCSSIVLDVLFILYTYLLYRGVN
jgi:hypothetical protein